MNRPEAEKVNVLVSDIFEKVNELLQIVNNSGDLELRNKTQRAVGTLIAELDMEVLEPVYKQFPDLRPPGMEEIKI